MPLPGVPLHTDLVNAVMQIPNYVRTTIAKGIAFSHCCQNRSCPPNTAGTFRNVKASSDERWLWQTICTNASGLMPPRFGWISIPSKAQLTWRQLQHPSIIKCFLRSGPKSPPKPSSRWRCCCNSNDGKCVSAMSQFVIVSCAIGLPSGFIGAGYGCIQGTAV